MATLKGQNVRILTYDGTTEKVTVVGMATNCVVTLTNNVDNTSTKDDVGLADKPQVTSRTGSVQVESLDVVDAAAMLTAVKAFKKFVLCWDQTSTTDNQTRVPAAFSRYAEAICNDLTLTFNNRENSAKSLQFTLVSAPADASGWHPQQDIVSAGTYTKGQFVRLFLSGDGMATPAAVIGGARQLSLHVSVSLEDSTTKDTTGDFQVQTPVGLSYDITTSALVDSGETITSQTGAMGLNNLETIHENGVPIKWQIANVSGDNNRTKGSILCSGLCQLTQLQLNASNRQSADYSATLNGYGDYTVAA